MTPKEKAQDLYNKMFYCFQEEIDKYKAKQCALIAVNEIINSFECFAESEDWKQVKEEIEKL
jgi:hypothetical protein